jgi:CRISPR-associated protein Cas2
MKGFGNPIHYSVFRCDLTPKGRIEMVISLTEAIKSDKDKVMIIELGPVDGKVEERIEFLGVHPPKRDRGAVIS